MLYDSSYILKRLNEKQEEDKHISSENDLLKAIKTINDSGENDVEQAVSTDRLLIAFSELRLKLAEHMKLDDVLFLFCNGASMYAGSKDT